MANGAGAGRGGTGVILAVETSCDDTCAALVTEAGEVRANVISSQGLLHARYGGVVPEVASRRHLELIDSVVGDALELAGATLDDAGTVAVTHGPGLIGALLVGVSWAKALAAARELPLAPVNHLHGHVVAGTLEPHPIETPYLCLVASGGHTFLARVRDPSRYDVLGTTLDDAAGEAFDKGARILGLPYPGGPALDALAREGDPGAFDFPRAAPGAGLDFSFSGVKTALLYAVRDLGEQEAERRRTDLAASYQRAIVAALLDRLERALASEEVPAAALGGGVAANSELRAGALELCESRGVPLHVPPRELCTDNAAMIAAAARFTPRLPYPDYLTLDASARPDASGGAGGDPSAGASPDVGASGGAGGDRSAGARPDVEAWGGAGGDRSAGASPDVGACGEAGGDPSGAVLAVAATEGSPPAKHKHKITLYGKPGCCLCDDVRVEIEELRAELGFQLEEVDVSIDPRLHRRYGERIPVVDVDGREVCELGLDTRAVRALMDRVVP